MKRFQKVASYLWEGQFIDNMQPKECMEGMSLAEYNRLSNSDDEWFRRQCVMTNFLDSVFSIDL